jgi:octaprenyl-diphosphate synthase
MRRATMQSLQDIASEHQDGQRAATFIAQAGVLMGDAMSQVNQRVSALTSQSPAGAQEAMAHLLDAGGKRLRPLLTLLAARAVGGDEGGAVGCAVAAELVHNATLLHDDVIDDGDVRRGRASARRVYGNTLSVLAGDLLMVTALREAQGTGPSDASSELLKVVTDMVEGEVLQLRHRNRFTMDRATYERIILLKTATLFAWCTRTGARAGGGGSVEVTALEQFGHHVGVAFQIRDDMLDLVGDPLRTGKPLGADLGEGKLTLPVLVALERQPELLDDVRAIACRGIPRAAGLLARVIQALRETGSLSRCHQELDRHQQKARDALGDLRPGPVVDLFGAVASALSLRER